VPWATPYVAKASSPEVMSLDGGAEITLLGVGFAKSAWLKCTMVQADPLGEFTLQPGIRSVDGADP
jgi:hypothetical protein